MTDNQMEEPRYVPTQGVPIAPNPARDKRTRIMETVIELQVAIEGCVALQSSHSSAPLTTALARASSIFLRKLVLGDRGNRESRLLSDDICEEADFRFSRIRKIPQARRTLTFCPIDVTVSMQITKLDEPGAGRFFCIPPSRQQLVFDVDWPLPGLTEWVHQPTEDDPWVIRAENLLDRTGTPTLDCDAWLGQQLVIFNGRGISLRKVLATTVNTEGAHSPPMDRLMKPEGQDDIRDRMIADSDAYILGNLRVCGVHYNHAIVIEAALALYQQLAQNSFFERPPGYLNIPLFCFVPEDVFSPNQKWLDFAGGLIVGGQGQGLTYTVKAPK